MNGILVVNKESSMTSRDVVNKVSKILGTKKIGHTGTLDPMARGVLVLVVGKYTKLVNLLTSTKKEYIASIKLGIETDTLDITGNVLSTEEIPKLNESNIVNTLNSFMGKSIQEVPIYSAVHVDGKRLYEYARLNESVLLPKREIEIYEIELLSYNNNEITFRVVVSKGTYIRSFIKDICSNLNILGTMSSLIRTKQGNFNINDSYTIKDVEDSNYKLLNIKDIFDIKEVECNYELYKKISNGVKNNEEGYILYKYNNIDVSLYYNGELLIMF